MTHLFLTLLLFQTSPPPSATHVDAFEGCAGSEARVIDGDTVDVNCSTWNNWERIRLLSVDTPERMRAGHQDGFKEAKAFTEAWFKANPSFLVLYASRDGRIERDKYGRILAVICPVTENNEEAFRQSLNSKLIVAGHSKLAFYDNPNQAIFHLTNNIGCTIVPCYAEPIPATQARP